MKGAMQIQRCGLALLCNPCSFRLCLINTKGKRLKAPGIACGTANVCPPWLRMNFYPQDCVSVQSSAAVCVTRR